MWKTSLLQRCLGPKDPRTHVKCIKMNETPSALTVLSWTIFSPDTQCKNIHNKKSEQTFEKYRSFLSEPTGSVMYIYLILCLLIV